MTNVRLIVLAALAPIALAAVLFSRVPQATATTIYGVAGDYNGVLPSSVFAIDPDAMTLTTIRSPLPGIGATLAAASPTALFLTIVDTTTVTSSLYAISISTGMLTSPIGSPAPVVSLGEGGDGFLYGTGSGPCCFVGLPEELYRIDPTDASYALRGAGARAYTGDLAADAAGNLFGSVATDLVTVSKLTGEQTVIGPTGLYLVGLAFSLDGRLWGATQSNELYQISPLSGAATFVMSLPVPGGALTFDLASEPTATPASLDHFTCYKAGATHGSERFAGIPNPPGISLVDQFGSSIVEVKKPKYLCAPTDKKNENPGAELHPEHLKGYPIKNRVSRVFPSNIKVVDQFNPGGLFVDAKKQSHLLVPTVKSRSAPPPLPGAFVTDHFQCYKVMKIMKSGPWFVPVPGVTLQDQFGPMTVDVKKPTFLCNPVDKNGEDPSAPSHTQHLMCYKVKQVDPVPFTKIVGVFVNNQFGPETLDVKKPSDLCVPALKNPPPPTPTPSATPTCVASPPPDCLGPDQIPCTADDTCLICPCAPTPTKTPSPTPTPTPTPCTCVGGPNAGLPCTGPSECPGGLCDCPTATPTPTITVTPTPTPTSTARVVDNGDGTVTDNQTGLQWEKKTDDGGVHDKDNLYTWTDTSDGDSTNPDGTAFTQFLATLNTTPCFAGQCDWRLPKVNRDGDLEELETIIDLTQGYCGGGSGACIDPIFGPTASFYWSATTFASYPGYAWLVYFYNGLVYSDFKGNGYYVRAVR